MKNAFLSEMSLRGFLNQCTDLEKLDKISTEILNELIKTTPKLKIYR